MASLIGEINEGNVIVPGALPIVTRLIAGTGITLTPASGTGDVTISDTTAGSGVQSVTGGLGITVGGTVTHPVVVNSGIRSLTAGSNVTLTGTTNDPIINATSDINSINAGTGVSVTGPVSDPVINNTGLLSASAGTGISVTSGQNPVISNNGLLSATAGSGINISPGQNPTSSNAGVISINAGPGIVVAGTGSIPVINNTGVLGVTAGSGITVGGTSSNPTISATGVTTVSAGSGVSITGTPTAPIVNNTGLLSASAGTGITVSAGQNPSIANTGILSLTAGSGINITGGQNATITATGASLPIPNAPVTFQLVTNGAGGTFFNAYEWGSVGNTINFANIFGPNGAPFSNCKGILLRFYGDQAVAGEPNVGWLTHYGGGGAGQNGVQYYLWTSPWSPQGSPPPRSAFLYNMGVYGGFGWDPTDFLYPTWQAYNFPYFMPGNALNQYTDFVVYPNLSPEVTMGVYFFSESGGGSPTIDFTTSITNIGVILHPLF